MRNYGNFDFDIDTDFYQESNSEDNYGELEIEGESAKPRRKSRRNADVDDDEEIKDVKEGADCYSNGRCGQKNQTKFDTECGDVDCETEACGGRRKSKPKKSKKHDDDDDDEFGFNQECGDSCKGGNCKRDVTIKSVKEDGDSANLDDAGGEDFGDVDDGGNEDSSEGSSFDTECGDVSSTEEGSLGDFFKNKFGKKSDTDDLAKETEEVKKIKDPAEKAKRTAELMKKQQEAIGKVGAGTGKVVGMEYALLPSIDAYSEEQLRSEREIMTVLMEELYKEYLMDDYAMSEEIVTESEEIDTEDGEVYQERFFGGTGKQAAGMVRPIAKGAKRLNDMKHGVGRHGIIRNVVHRTQKDLRKGGVAYKLLTWPFLVIKNLVQTLYHKTKSFIMYKGLLLGIEVKINREISKIRKRARNLPKMALAGGIGYATAALAATAKGEQLPLKPADFIASEGAKLVEELGRDTMIRALTSKLAEAIEESPEAIRAVIAKQKEGKNLGKVTPDMGKDAPPVISVNQNKITVEGLINMRGIDEMLNDIDTWADIAESVAIDVRSGDEASVRGYLDKIESMEAKYLQDGKLNLEMIFNSKSGSVKIADFYEELSSKLTEKTKKLEKGLEKITGLENAIKEGNVQVASDTEKSLAEINTSIQHTCNAFLEMIDSIDDLGKYVMSTMETYLDCLEATSATLANTKGGKGASEEADDGEDEPKKKKRHKFLHFGKKNKDEEVDDEDA